jgi:hypothetical protein
MTPCFQVRWWDKDLFVWGDGISHPLCWLGAKMLRTVPTFGGNKT